MKVCPAPDCPHRVKFGRAAEFHDGVDRCSDCGSTLVPPSPELPRFRLPFPRVLTRRLLWTGGTVLALWAGLFLPMPLLNHEVARLQARFMGDLLPVVALLGLAALLDDLIREVRCRRNTPGGADLVPAESWQDVADAVEAFRDRPVEGACLQGLRFRTLTYFFGPYVPITRLVPEERSVKP